MTKQVENEPAGKKNVGLILLLSAALVLPSSTWMVFGWISCFLPLIVFVSIYKYGWKYTNKHILISGGAAVIAGLVGQRLELVLFGIMLLPGGYMVAVSARRREIPWLAGLKGWLVLASSLFIFFNILLINSDATFLQAVADSLSRGIDEALKQYRSSGGLSAENYLVLEQSLLQVKKTAPLILPAILSSMLLIIVWLTLVLGNTLLPALGATRPWTQYRYWNLPDKMIWILIVSGIIAAIPGQPARNIGINTVIVVTVLYSFQGLAILVFYLHKWNVPRFARTVIYIVMMLQSFGTVLLVTAGIADVWFDLRKLSSPVVKNDNKDPE